MAGISMSLLKKILAALLLAILTSPSHAQQDSANEELVVGVHAFTPLVMATSDGAYTGLAIELWEAIAEKTGLTFRYQDIPDFKDLFPSVQAGTFDVVVGGLTITGEREDAYTDFTQPYFNSGLRIMVGGTADSSIWLVVDALMTKLTLQAFLVFFLISVGGWRRGLLRRPGRWRGRVDRRSARVREFSKAPGVRLPSAPRSASVTSCQTAGSASWWPSRSSSPAPSSPA